MNAGIVQPSTGLSGGRSKRRARRMPRAAIVAGKYLASLIVAIVLLGPIIWMVLTTFEPASRIAAKSLSIDVRSFTFENYREALLGIPGIGSVDLAGGLRRSFVTASVSSLISLAVSSCAAYALARFQFRGRGAVSIGVLFTQVVPAILLVVPLYSLLNGIHLTNSLLGLLIVYTAITLPFSTILLRGYFITIPEEIEQAALVDGCGYLGVLFRIVYRLALPAFVAVFIYDFLSVWNEFLFAFVLSGNYQTLTVTLYGYSMQLLIYWGPLLAASVIATLPALVLFLPMQRYLVGGLTAGAVK
jgi:ABC-type glycerol-3-phosphate transport system permease component